MDNTGKTHSTVLEAIVLEATVLDIKTKKATREFLKKIDISKEWKPILIRSNFNSFFDCLIENADNLTPSKGNEVCKEKIESTRKIIENRNSFNFLENSSIWIRFCDNENWEGKVEVDKNGQSSVPQSVQDALQEFNWFQKLGLYKIKPAKEFIDYHFRVQQENYLKNLGHGVFVTPMIYSDETKFREFFLGNSSDICFKFLNSDKEKGFQTKDVSLRILLVDDKICENSNIPDNATKFIKCNCENCPKTLEYCKLQMIRKLIDGSFILDNEKCDKFKNKTYWVDSKEVDCFVVDKVYVSEVWKKDKNTEKLVLKGDVYSKLNKIMNPTNQEEFSKVQIVGVRDLETALTLLSCCKFDIILLDYLLGKRSVNGKERTYSTELFEFLSYDFKRKDKKKDKEVPVIIRMLKDSNTEFGDNQLKLKEFQDNVKLNRGPLDKFWIIPMTSYNSSFISDLQRKHVKLIDHRWNISQGADPINTPWKFLHKLNEFIDLQLRSCVFHMEQLLRFLNYTCEDLKELSDKKGNKLQFFDFQSFMGAEYSTFMRRYGNRHLIQRDAVWNESEGNLENKSLFSSYIWKNFYVNPEYRDVIELNRLIQRFLHHASVMQNDRNGQQRLDETFGQLSFFIDVNKKVQDCNFKLYENKFYLSEPLSELHVIMDKVMSQ